MSDNLIILLCRVIKYIYERRIRLPPPTRSSIFLKMKKTIKILLSDENGEFRFNALQNKLHLENMCNFSYLQSKIQL